MSEQELKEPEQQEQVSEQPDMSADMADAEFSEQIEQQTKPQSDEFEDWDETETGDIADEFEIGDDAVSVGDIYCNILTMLANEMSKKHGSGDAPFETDDGELDTTLAKQLELDTYVNQVMKRRSMGNLSPEQALLVSTAIFICAVLVTDSELMGNIMSKVNER